MHPYHIHFMCKNTKDVQCKKQLHVDGKSLFSHGGGLSGQQHCILTAQRQRQAVGSAFVRKIFVPNTALKSTTPHEVDWTALV